MNGNNTYHVSEIGRWSGFSAGYLLVMPISYKARANYPLSSAVPYVVNRGKYPRIGVFNYDIYCRVSLQFVGI